MKIGKILKYFGISVLAVLNTSALRWGIGNYKDQDQNNIISDVKEFYSNGRAAAILKKDDSVVTWGYKKYGGDSSYSGSIQVGHGALLEINSVQGSLTNIKKIFTTNYDTELWGGAFVALKQDGSVVSWGASDLGGNSLLVADQLRSGVVDVFSTWGAFAALKKDGSVVTWGSPNLGGDSYSVANQLRSGIVNVFSNAGAFVALKKDGSVVTWGDIRYGGDSKYSGSVSTPYSDYVKVKISSAKGSLTNVKQVFSTKYITRQDAGAFAALKKDGSVVSWGATEYGGDSSAVATKLRSGVVSIFSTTQAFAALKKDGSVVTWGASSFGGDSSKVAMQLRSNVIKIVSVLGNYNEAAFAALKKDGSSVSWGGLKKESIFSSGLKSLSSGVKDIVSSRYAFAALKEDGSVVSWGNDQSGGNSSRVADKLRSGVASIFSTDEAFAALKEDGTVVSWGSNKNGGNSSSVKSKLKNIVNIYSNSRAFAAVSKDGTVVAWGDKNSGGHIPRKMRKQLKNITNIFTMWEGFGALREDRTLILWGVGKNFFE